MRLALAVAVIFIPIGLRSSRRQFNESQTEG
jgi:hypothetical protein